MFAPILPRPIIPICMMVSFVDLHQHLLDCCSTAFPDRRPYWRRGGQTMPCAFALQHLEVAARLRGCDHSEGVLLPENRQVGRVVSSDLKEDALALVKTRPTAPEDIVF